MPRVLSLAAFACDVCASTNPQIQSCRGQYGQAKTTSSLSSPPHTRTFLTTSGIDSSLPYAKITLNVMRSWRLDPSLSAWSGLHHLSYDFSAHPIHPPGQLFSDPDHRAFTLGPALTHYRCQRVYVVSSRSERITLTPTSLYPYSTSPSLTFALNASPSP